MTFSIEEFKANAVKYGFARPNFFLLAIPSAPAWYGGSTRFLTYLCSGAALPGTQVITAEEKIGGYGKTKKIPYDAAHTDLNLTFYSDGNGEVLSFFENWARNIVVYGKDDGNIKGSLRGEVHYPDHYQTRMEIYQYNENPGSGNIEIFKYVLNNAYPISIGEQALSWDQGDEISTINVGITFKDYWIEKNVAGKYGDLESMRRDTAYMFNQERGGYAAEWLDRANRGENALAITAGTFLSSLTAPLGMISKYSSLVNDKLNVVNNIGANVNSALGSYTGLLKQKPPSIPSFPNVRFP